MQFRKILTFLLIAAIMTPVLIMFLLGVGRLLAAMEDLGGALLLDRLALLLFLTWVGDLVAIVLMLAADRANPDRDSEDARGD